MRVGPARQLWHPVSARAVVAMLWRSTLRVWPWALKSSLWDDTLTSMLGWGGERRWVQVMVLESHDWWGSDPSVIVDTVSDIALSCSACLDQHI